jgi:zeaxanthin epoxidase|eukprot:scaffold196_cov225-Chaetoceros_neogracile.AAC.4
MVAVNPVDVATYETVESAITEENPLRVLIAGAGVGGLALANTLSKNPKMKVTVLERTDEFKRFGGPIQLASNALVALEDMDTDVYNQVMSKFTFTGDKKNGIKDGIRDEWYAMFDLKTPAEDRNMPYTGVIERPDLQQIYLDKLPKEMVCNGDGVISYETNSNGHGVKAVMESGKTIEGDVLLGADGIWSAVRAKMRDEPLRGDGSGVSYSGYTVFAGELDYASFDNGEVGYKVYIGPGQYFVITDIGKGRYQWYAFLAKPPGSAEEEEKPDGDSIYLQDVFTGWSKDIHHILKTTTEDEIQQRDLYDRPPSVIKAWSKGNVALLGDSVHAMMPNLGQGGCQAIEDAYVLAQELESATSRNEIEGKLRKYRGRRLIRSAAVQGLSRFASDIIIRGFDTPAKVILKDGIKFENFNYAGIVTKVLQPILPVFFTIQFAFLYDGWKNNSLDLKSAFLFLVVGGFILAVSLGLLEEGALLGGIGLEGLFAGEGFAGFEGFETLVANVQDFFPFL